MKNGKTSKYASAKTIITPIEHMEQAAVFAELHQSKANEDYIAQLTALFAIEADEIGISKAAERKALISEWLFYAGMIEAERRHRAQKTGAKAAPETVLSSAQWIFLHTIGSQFSAASPAEYVGRLNPLDIARQIDYYGLKGLVLQYADSRKGGADR